MMFFDNYKPKYDYLDAAISSSLNNKLHVLRNITVCVYVVNRKNLVKKD